MITREEALQMTHDCRITSLGELAHGYVIYQVAAKDIINQLFDQQDQLEQHIKSLEAQLSNTEQLTCEWVKDARGEEYELLPVFYTKCGSSFVFSECGIAENNFIFCPYCGGKITSKDTQ